MEDNADFLEIIKENLSRSVFDLDGMKADLGIDTLYLQKCIEQLIQITVEVRQGIITPDTLKLIIKANKYDQAIAEATKKGEFAGYANYQAEMLRKKRLENQERKSIYELGNEKRYR